MDILKIVDLIYEAQGKINGVESILDAIGNTGNSYILGDTTHTCEVLQDALINSRDLLQDALDILTEE